MFIQSIVIDIRTVVAWGWAVVSMIDRKGTRELSGVMKMFCVVIGVMVTHVYTIIKTYRIVHLTNIYVYIN